MSESDDFCFGCKRSMRNNKKQQKTKKSSKKEDFISGQDLLICEFNNCNRSWCLKCLKLSAVPDEEFICPIHKCNVEGCSKTIKSFKCYNCQNSLCDNHYNMSFNKRPDSIKGLKFTKRKDGLSWRCNECPSENDKKSKKN